MILVILYLNGTLAPRLHFLQHCSLDVPKFMISLALGIVSVDEEHLFSSFIPANSNLHRVFAGLPMSEHVHCGDNNAPIESPTSTCMFRVCHVVLDYQRPQLSLLIGIGVMSSQQSF